MDDMRRQLRQLTYELREATKALDEKPPNLEHVLDALREVELRLHDARRSLERLLYG